MADEMPRVQVIAEQHLEGYRWYVVPADLAAFVDAHLATRNGGSAPLPAASPPQVQARGAAELANQPALYRCGYCRAWCSKPCGEGCMWDRSEPFTEADAIRALAPAGQEAPASRGLVAQYKLTESQATSAALWAYIAELRGAVGLLAAYEPSIDEHLALRGELGDLIARVKRAADKPVPKGGADAVAATAPRQGETA